MGFEKVNKSIHKSLKMRPWRAPGGLGKLSFRGARNGEHIKMKLT
jgi:hypothetical protein